MNDYFQHLIDRSTNQTPAVRPQLPSLFEFPDFHASPLIAGLEAETIDDPREKTAKMPDICSGLPPLDESPAFHACTATDDPADETIHGLRKKAEREDTVPVLREKESNLLPTAGHSKRLNADIRDKEALPEKLIRGDVSENHKKDTEYTMSPYLHTQTADTFSGETVNPVSRKTVFKNVPLTASLPDTQFSAVLNPGTNQKPDRLLVTVDKAKKEAQRVSPVEPAPALQASATVSNQIYDFPARVGKPPRIRPLIATETRSQLLPAFLPQQAPPEKTIKVTIGRIEVRAVMPQAPLSGPQTYPQETQPKISLEDYLKKQRGGSR